MPLSAAQRGAVEASIDARLMVLTGGPGTGKTTTVRALVAAQRALGRTILLCAPTGRAAKRLSEATGAEARTIHRLLEWNPALGRFRRDARNPLDADVILVDEASMLDLRLSSQLLDAVAAASSLVLVGDIDQLPPVGPGSVLRDVIESGVAEVVRLREVFRQARESAIVRGAHAIEGGGLPEPTPRGEKGSGDLFFIQERDPEKVAETLVRVVDRVRTSYELDVLRDLQVLTPMRRGPLGTERLNELLRAALNPAPADEQDAPQKAPARRFRAGDKVMQLRNDYDKDVYNGDLGVVARVEGGSTFIQVDGREVQYGVEDLDSLTHAYASTVHKVQGSEFPAVIVVLYGGHHVLLSRALLYTAITRAKRLVVLLGDRGSFARAAANAASRQTESFLAPRLRALVERDR